MSDASVVAGLRRAAESGLTWDASASYGMHESDFFFLNTVNASLGLDTPREFDPGLYRQEEVNLNFDVSYAATDLVNIAAGRGVARRALHDRRGRAPVVGGRAVCGPGIRIRVQRLSGLSRLHGRHLEPQQRGALRRPRAARPGRSLDAGRRRAVRALRHLRGHDERQALGPLRAERRRLDSRRHQHRLPRADARAAEHAQRADDHRSRDAAARRQRQRAVHLPGRATARRPAARTRDVLQHDRGD